MKKLFLIFSLLFSFNIFATGNTTMVPVSTQKVNNATLTCPTGKWCRVVVNYSMGGDCGTSCSYLEVANINNSFEVILKSGEAIAGSVVNPGGSCGSGSITITIAGTTIAKNIYGIIASGGSPTCITTSNYSFYSMEYWN